MTQYLSSFTQDFEPSASYRDPVEKLRVSTPENLIDTDFEYGLQSTKWETIELSNNIPSFYVSDSDISLSSVDSITARSGSQIILVQTTEPHGLVESSPIDIRGLTSRTAEGKYLIKSVPSETSFTYVANSPQTASGEIGSVYTSITPGQFYSGSQIPFKPDSGVVSDEQTPSTLTVETQYANGFNSGSNLYLINTLGSKRLDLTQTTQNAADGRPFVDHSNTIVNSYSPNLTLTETKQKRSTYYKKFNVGDVDIINNRISWPGHRLRENDCVLYIPPAGDDAIEGLKRFFVYYVKNPIEGISIQLSETFDGPVIDFESTGTYNYGRAGLHLCYEIRFAQHTRFDNYTYWYTRASQEGTGSGWDLLDSSEYSTITGWNDLGKTIPTNKILFSTSGGTVDQRHAQYAYSTAYNSAMVFDEQTTLPGLFNFIEDFERYRSHSTFKVSSFSAFDEGYFRNLLDNDGTYYSSASYGTNYTSLYMMMLVDDEERDTFFFQNHGFNNGEIVPLVKNSGNSIVKGNSTTDLYNTVAYTALADGNYTIEVVSPDRFRFLGNRIAQATGSYTISREVINPTKNSFYSTHHGFAGGETINIYQGNLGVLPSTTSGLVVFDAATTSGNLKGAWNILNSYMDTYTSGLANHQDLVLDGTEGSATYIRTGITSGTPGISAAFIDSVIMQDSTIGTVNNVGVYQNNQRPTEVKDAATGTILADRNFSYIGTRWTAGELVPHYSQAYSVPGDPNYTTKFEVYHRMTFPSTRSQYSWNNRSYTIAGDNGWRSTANFVWSTRTSAINAVKFEVTFWNENWDATSTDSFTTFNQGTYFYTVGTGRKYIKFTSIFLVNASSPWSNALSDSLISSMLTDFASKFQYPTLSNGSDKVVRVLTADRFYLEDPLTAIEVDITNSGTPQIYFLEEGTSNILDGSYTISNILNDNIFQIALPFNIPKTTVQFNAATISNNLINIPDGHNFSPGTRVVYQNLGNSSISGLTNDGIYYVYVQDDKYIGLAESYNDALTQNIVTLSAGTGTHAIETNRINGRFKGPGTVTIESGSKSVVGDQSTLFKRYFKVGDTIGIKDTTQTPGSIEVFTISAIADDSNMELSESPNFSATDTHYFIGTKIYARPDGYAVHRPFDGGVEIAAGTAPDSTIVRQTRKYFRYQSGKGIQTSLAINFNPPVSVETLVSNGIEATVVTRYPHRLSVGSSININGASDDVYNGNTNVTTIIDDVTFTYTLSDNPSTTVPSGIIQYNLNGYTGAATRAGMFDFQNGFFFEFDGNTLYCVRRSSTQQISGRATVVNNSNLVTGINTNFIGQLAEGDYVVIRGGSYKVVSINSRTEMVVQPQYKGASATDIILTKTVDVKVPQSQWSIDPCDGNGPSGYLLDINKIQMAYMDYSWYGAGKVRFGFKETEGRVRYVHEFVHNNRLDEAYMRSGNLPARYEISNDANPSYVPTLFHWGTSVIMDGRFDEDEAYLFTSTSDSLTFTNGQSVQSTTNANSQLIGIYRNNTRTYDWYVRLSFPSADDNKFSSGSPLYTVDEALNGQQVAYTQFSGNNILVNIFIQRSFSPPPVTTYPSIASGTIVYVGGAPSGNSEINLGTANIPLITIRLAPSVDSNLSGDLGFRDVINRMQLKLAEVGLTITHDCEVSLVLNGDLSTANWQNVDSPSLSQLIKHQSGDRVLGGAKIFSFSAAGGSSDSTGKRLSNTSNFSLQQVVDLGNSVLGGNGTFPNGPDILTVIVRVSDTQGISATSPFTASARVTWAESQA